MSSSPGIGWVRGNVAASTDLLEQINNIRTQHDLVISENERLKAAFIPDLEGIASFDSSFEVRYSWTDYRGREPRQGTSGLALTWRQIFAAVAPSLIRPSDPSIISTCVVRYIKENMGLSHLKVSIFDTDENTIKIQLVAYGLIKAYAAEAKGGGVGEFISITDKGTRVMIESTMVRAHRPAGKVADA